MKKFQPVPSTVLFNLFSGNRRRSIHDREVLFEGVRLRLSVYELSPRLVSLLPRIGAHSALDLGLFPENGKSVHLYGKSVRLDFLREVFERKPYVIALCVEKGRDPDTRAVRWRLITSLSFASMELLEEAVLRVVKQYADHKPVKDNQRKRLYAWETQFFASRKIRQHSEQALVTQANQIIEHFHIPRERIHVTSTPSRSARRLGVCQTLRDDVVATIPTFVIVNIHDSTMDTLYHEMAHVLVNFGYNRAHRVQAHGGEFCRVYAHLLGEYSRMDTANNIVDSMFEGRLKVATSDLVATLRHQITN